MCSRSVRIHDKKGESHDAHFLFHRSRGDPFPGPAHDVRGLRHGRACRGIAFDLIFPAYAMYETWSGLLPGFVWLTPVGFIIGLVESFLYGWYAALIFGALYNAIAARGTAT